MLYYSRIEVSEGIDVNKTSAPKGFMFQLSVCNGCHDVLMISYDEPWWCCHFKHLWCWLLLY